MYVYDTYMFLLFSLGDLFVVFDFLKGCLSTVIIDTPCSNFALLYYVILEMFIQCFCFDSRILALLVTYTECK